MFIRAILICLFVFSGSNSVNVFELINKRLTTSSHLLTNDLIVLNGTIRADTQFSCDFINNLFFV
jgi:hypothetical protein